MGTKYDREGFRYRAKGIHHSASHKTSPLNRTRITPAQSRRMLLLAAGAVVALFAGGRLLQQAQETGPARLHRAPAIVVSREAEKTVSGETKYAVSLEIRPEESAPPVKATVSVAASDWNDLAAGDEVLVEFRVPENGSGVDVRRLYTPKETPGQEPDQS